MLTEIVAMFVLLLAPYDLPVPEIRFASGMQALGTTFCRDDYSECKIAINECLKDNPKLLHTTAKHELAHYIAGLTTHTADHGSHWKRVVREIGAKTRARTIQQC
ncbi:MAG: putative SprT family Zn-dependent metalloprotease [Candidatus Azotimanducaceae bacterium]|jgi:predicted SprT family Zn-dependent metalloprotease